MRTPFTSALEDFDGIPFDALNYMVAEANYGGRVTDNQDRRAIVCFVKDYYTPEILKDEYKFSISGIYYAPPETVLAGYLEFIRNFPISTTPETFWLHNNAKLTAAINDGAYVGAGHFQLDGYPFGCERSNQQVKTEWNNSLDF